jgi:hypothetical protein
MAFGYAKSGKQVCSGKPIPVLWHSFTLLYTVKHNEQGETVNSRLGLSKIALMMLKRGFYTTCIAKKRKKC